MQYDHANEYLVSLFTPSEDGTWKRTLFEAPSLEELQTRVKASGLKDWVADPVSHVTSYIYGVEF